MSLKIKRILWIILGITFLFFLKVTVIIPGLHFIFAIFCFKRAYDINKRVNVAHLAAE